MIIETTLSVALSQSNALFAHIWLPSILQWPYPLKKECCAEQKKVKEKIYTSSRKGIYIQPLPQLPVFIMHCYIVFHIVDSTIVNRVVWPYPHGIAERLWLPVEEDDHKMTIKIPTPIPKSKHNSVIIPHYICLYCYHCFELSSSVKPPMDWIQVCCLQPPDLALPGLTSKRW